MMTGTCYRSMSFLPHCLSFHLEHLNKTFLLRSAYRLGLFLLAASHAFLDSPSVYLGKKKDRPSIILNRSPLVLQFPALYQQGPKNLFFDWPRILGWMGNGLYSSLIIFFLNIIIFYDQAFSSGGQTADMAVMGTAMFTCIIWAVNCQIALTMSHFTWIQHLLVWGSVAMWYLFLLLYGMMSPTYSGNAFQILLEALGPAPIFWSATLLVTIACNLPYLAHISFQRCFNPMDHHIIQEIKYYKKDVEDQHMWTRERSKARQETKIGFTARVDAKIRQLRGRLQKKHTSIAVQTTASTL